MQIQPPFATIDFWRFEPAYQPIFDSCSVYIFFAITAIGTPSQTDEVATGIITTP